MGWTVGRISASACAASSALEIFSGSKKAARGPERSSGVQKFSAAPNACPRSVQKGKRAKKLKMPGDAKTDIAIAGVRIGTVEGFPLCHLAHK
jgi:hypothetical protein